MTLLTDEQRAQMLANGAARVRGDFCERYAACGAWRAGSGNDFNALCRNFYASGQKRFKFLRFQRNGLAGAARNDECVGAAVNLIFDKAGQRSKIDAVVGQKRRD